jgi:hypothetical protein
MLVDVGLTRQVSARPINNELSLLSIATGYQMFLVEWLRIAHQELEAVFGQPRPVPTW